MDEYSEYPAVCQVGFICGHAEYAINAVFFENYWNDGSPKEQQRYFDNIVVSTQRIGCLDVSREGFPRGHKARSPAISILWSRQLRSVRVIIPAAVRATGTCTVGVWSPDGRCLSKRVTELRSPRAVIDLFLPGCSAGVYIVRLLGDHLQAAATLLITG